MAIVHNYPKETEFIYKNKIIVQDAVAKQKAKTLINWFDNYWDEKKKNR